MYLSVSDSCGCLVVSPLPMRSALSFFPSFSAILHHRPLLVPTTPSLLHLSRSFSLALQPRWSFSNAPLSITSVPTSSLVERVRYKSKDDKWDFPNHKEAESFDFDGVLASPELKHIDSLSLEVKELGELPEQWRRSRLAWLCKELPAQKPVSIIRVLNAQRKWIRQDDATYVVAHCLRIRENDAGFRVYKWMLQQHWFKFDFSLATKLADCMGKERKHLKCREIYDDIINQGRVPCESTFHILIVSYLSSPSQACLQEACNIYNRMIHLGGYKPLLSLHNCLFRALVKKPGSLSKDYLKMAEFIFHNLITFKLEIHKDIYGGLIWLHSHQENVDMKRIEELRSEMRTAGVEEGIEVVLSILRACSKSGDLEEAESTWTKLACSGYNFPSQAFTDMMEVYARVGHSMKSLQLFRDVQKQLNSGVVAYHKIIEILCKALEQELAESLMEEFVDSGLMPLTPSFIELMNMYLKLGLHDKIESSFGYCLKKARPNQMIYNIYLDSLVQIGNLDKVDEIFYQMYKSEEIDVNARSCNAVMKCYLSHGEFVKAEKIYDLMCQKNFDIEPLLMEKLDHVLRSRKRTVKRPISLKLSKEQREMLVGLLLGGLRILSDEGRKRHALHFEFNSNLQAHSILKRYIHDQYCKWLAVNDYSSNEDDDIRFQFTTILHSYFGFYADQFWPKGQPTIPRLIHRWLSPRVLGFWYMYGGYKTSSGDILLKVMGSREGVGRIVKALNAKSLNCRVKQKGRYFWICLPGSNSVWFWKLVEPFIPEELHDILNPGNESSEPLVKAHDITFYSDVISDSSDVEGS